MAFHTIKQLQLQGIGPVSLQAKKWRSVHLTQGSVDGACGPYSVMMALLILGCIRWDEVTSFDFWFDPAHGKGKLWSMLEKRSGFLRDGTDLKDLQTLLHKSFGEVLTTTAKDGATAGFLEFVIESLQNHRPVIVGVSYSKSAGHWLVIIGYEEDAQGNVTKLLALDSSADAPQLCVWNAYIEVANPARGRQYRYSWVKASDITAVKFDDALAISRQ